LAHQLCTNPVAACGRIAIVFGWDFNLERNKEKYGEYSPLESNKDDPIVSVLILWPSFIFESLMHVPPLLNLNQYVYSNIMVVESFITAASKNQKRYAYAGKTVIIVNVWATT
jgi:hypothetical protein